MAVSKPDVTPDNSSLDGLDSFFDSSGPVLSDVLSDVTTDAEVDHFWNLSEAAKHLGISTRTVLRHLKNGRLDGAKVPGPNGPEWRIRAIDTADMTLRMTNDHVSTCPDSVMSGVITTPDSTGLWALLQEKEAQIREKDAKIEALTYRTGYLESQVQSHQEQIKLLTDRHRIWWHRFASWWLGKGGQQ